MTMSESRETTRIDWQAAPCVFVPLPPKALCPACGYDDHATIRSQPVESDGSRARRCVCRNCGSPFLIVTEPDCQGLAG